MMIKFNDQIKLILSDVDETIADVYTPASPAMIHELSLLLEEGRKLFLISGGGLDSIRKRITDKIKPQLRSNILIAHCMGAEVWGFQPNGEIMDQPHYGVYNSQFTLDQKQLWRIIINQIIDEFQLKIYPTQPRDQFITTSNANPLAIMLADRGPQITFECVNSTNLNSNQVTQIESLLKINIPKTHNNYDLRIPILERANTLYRQNNLNITPKLGGIFALDHIIQGVNKTQAIQQVLNSEPILNSIGLSRQSIDQAMEMEIWGDKYSQLRGGPDFDMCLAVSPKTRAIDFRLENLDEIPKGYNIQIWSQHHHLHNGLLEYLQDRHNNN